jgi:uncharacterized OB-fold protein
MSVNAYTKPVPHPTPISKPFWEAARRHELILQQCSDCGISIYYPRSRCPRCMSNRLEWKPCSGRGTVYSYTVVWRTPTRAFADQPYVLAIIELEEGARMTSNVLAPHDQMRVGMPVKVSFDDVTPDISLVKFVPA